jgi:dTDP-glucose 4,6-dehydratase
MKKVIYITGCFGFIGSYVTRLALKKGWHVRGIDKCTYDSRKETLLNEFSKYSNFFFEENDIANLKNLFDCDYIVNTAAETHVGNSIVNSEDFIHSNIQGVHSILEAIRKYKVEGTKKPTIFHFSTDEVYGDINEGSFNENDILLPSNPYSATKAAADMLIKAWARTYNINYIILRPSNNYGIGQYIEKLIPKSIKYLELNKKIPLHNNGSPVRSWLHAEDTASAVIHLIEQNKINEIYNVSGNYYDSNLNVVKKIISCFNSDQDFNKYLDLSYSRVGQDVRYSVDDTKLKQTGWKPVKQFDEELSEIVNFYKNNYIW